MRMRPVVFFLPLLLLMYTAAWARDCKLVGIDELKGWLEGRRPLYIVDIQPEKEYQKQHFADAIATAAFPAESDEQRARLDQGAAAYARENRDVVVVGQQSQEAEQRACAYLRSKGVPPERIFILKGGMASWPYNDFLIKEGCG